jgi:hypothetical protein
MLYYNALTAEMLNVKKSKDERYLAGYVFIEFRNDYHGNNKKPTFINTYILNSQDDGWFRRTEGKLKGYGLAINELKLTSTAPKQIGSFKAYCAKMKYISFNDENEIEEEFIWLVVHDRFDIVDVLEHIKENVDLWYP